MTAGIYCYLPRSALIERRYSSAHPLAWRMGEIVGTELKVLSQCGEDFLKGHSQIGFDARTSGRSFESRKIRYCAAKSDPYRRAPYRKPTAWRVKSIASQNHARNDRHL